MSVVHPAASATEKTTLTAADWERAALDLIAEKGLSGLGVEPLARRLGITKGSFYWHFPTRDQLLEQALSRWERQDTESLARSLDSALPAAERLAEFVLRTSRQNRSHQIHAALCAASDDPRVRPVLERVTQRRLDYLAKAFRELGLDPESARHRARLTYTSYVGYIQLQSRGMAPERGSDEFEAYVQHAIETLIDTH
ncbi:TetR/AcrR family transcriptional regulator [Wenzhouxiangella sp. XN79A]|uniref:TetR/AcrR family transcriptional regulator n=1 Tax=Wenzhouxiangella sp. XN79A TaxID=2724193 RepID=UPI00144AAF5E|nr:TetR/AcrR family transcriptional regulator [Wenzhouxiangella sp. XN79A]NKI33879.1 TetR/AcrR family transcriptional regulator [Wenzhouxiangella sp. XN79A]